MKFAEWIERLIVTDDDPLTGIYDYAVGIGIDTTPDGRNPSPHSEAVAWKCRELLIAERARNIQLLGGYKVPGGFPEAWTMYQLLRGQTPPNLLDRRTFIETLSDRTYKNADAALRIFHKSGVRRIVVVAQQLHARRVRATFRRRLAGSGIEIAVVKAWGAYTQNCSQRRLRSFWSFFAWDTLSFALGKIKGWN